MIETVKYLDIHDKSLPPACYNFLFAYYTANDLLQGNDMIYSLPLDLNDWDELKGLPGEDEEEFEDSGWAAIQKEYEDRKKYSKTAIPETLEEAFTLFQEWTKSQGVVFAHGNEEEFLVKVWW